MLPVMLERLLINREYAKLWLGSAVSNLGDVIFDTTLVLWVGTVIARGQTWGPLAVSGALLAVAVPAMLVAPLAGVFVDRWDYRRTMLASDAIRAVLVAAMLPLAFLTLPVPAQLGLIYALLLLASISAQFFNPARFAIIGDLVGDEHRPRASSIAQVTFALTGVIGPPLAAPLLFTVGVQWALAINVVSFLVSFVMVRAIRVPAVVASARTRAGAPGIWSEFVAGLRFFVRSRVLTTVVVTAAIVTVGAGCVNALDVFFVSANLHAGAKWFGLLSMAFGAGSIVGALATGTLAGRLGYARTYSWGLLLFGVALLGFARSGHVAVAMVLLFAAGVPVSAVNTVVGPIILRVTPREMVGRVISMVNPLLQLAAMLSIAVAGWLASTGLRGLDTRVAGVHIGPIDTIYTGGGVLALLGGAWAVFAMRPADLSAPADQPVPVDQAEPGATPPAPADPST